MRHPADRRLVAAVAVLAGALPALAFPAPGLWWFAYLALVPWLVLLSHAPNGRRAAFLGWLGGTGLMISTHHWLLPNLHVFLLLLSLLVGALWAPWGWLVHRLLAPSAPAHRAVAAVVLVPAGWLTAELARSWEYLGGPWGLLGASQWQRSPALALMSVGGVWLVSLLLVGVNTAVATLLPALWARRRPQRPTGASRVRGYAAVGGLVVVALALAAGTWWVERPASSGTVRVAVVQPGVVDGAQARFVRGLDLTEQLSGRSVDLVVWGESSVGFDPASRPELAQALRELSGQLDSPLLINVDARRPGERGIHKSSVLVDGQGLTGERYDKMRLVPFGEYVPARGLLGWVTSVGRAAEEDRRRGTERRLLEAGDLRLGPLICFETAFPDMSRQLTADGARLLVAQSATSTFQDSWAPEQHASLAALRSAETGRSVVHGTLTGVSAVFGPGGERIGPALGTDYSGVREYSAPLGVSTTAYVRHGDWAPRLAVAALVGYAVVSLGSHLVGSGAFRRRPTARS